MFQSIFPPIVPTIRPIQVMPSESPYLINFSPDPSEKERTPIAWAIPDTTQVCSTWTLETGFFYIMHGCSVHLSSSVHLHCTSVIHTWVFFLVDGGLFCETLQCVVHVN